MLSTHRYWDTVVGGDSGTEAPDEVRNRGRGRFRPSSVCVVAAGPLRSWSGAVPWGSAELAGGRRAAVGEELPAALGLGALVNRVRRGGERGGSARRNSRFASCSHGHRAVALPPVAAQRVQRAVVAGRAYAYPSTVLRPSASASSASVAHARDDVGWAAATSAAGVPAASASRGPGSSGSSVGRWLAEQVLVRHRTILALVRAHPSGVTFGDPLITSCDEAPKVQLRDGAVLAAEALVRWEHPERGIIGPDDFIPVAEHSGLITPLTYWVLAPVAGGLRVVAPGRVGGRCRGEHLAAQPRSSRRSSTRWPGRWRPSRCRPTR